MDLLRVALPRLFCERLLVETFGRDEDWLFTVVLRVDRGADALLPVFLAGVARCVFAGVARCVFAGVARCVRVGVRLLWLTVGVLDRCTPDVERFWRAGVVARLVLRGVLPVLRTEFVFGAVARVRVAGVADSRVWLVLFGRTASRVLFVRVASVFRVAAPRAAVAVPRLLAGCVVAARPLVARLAERTVDASATREGRADERLLRSTSGR